LTTVGTVTCRTFSINGNGGEESRIAERQTERVCGREAAQGGKEEVVSVIK